MPEINILEEMSQQHREGETDLFIKGYPFLTDLLS